MAQGPGLPRKAQWLGPIVLALAACLAAGPAAAGSPGDFASNLATFAYDKALDKAREEKKLTFVYFWTPSCPYCREFSDAVLGDPDVLESLGRYFVVVSVNADRERKLSRKFRLPSVPYLAFLDSSGQVVSIIPGAVARDFFLVYLEYLRTGAYSDQEFRAFVESLT
ncbi:MAG: thioredoxin fold domain-containing protein [Deltaproteobacteria bacterium]|jgi:thioredoxin-related protein|nr:thioredoxin fold domain-containing protein [Deltaproteobacteria bacterium]